MLDFKGLWSYLNGNLQPLIFVGYKKVELAFSENASPLRG